MVRAGAAATTLLDVVTTRTSSRSLQIAGRAGAVLLVTLSTAVAAQISLPLPFTPVPFTFQPMVVLLGGAILGARLGPTGGYLIGYPFAAFVAGWLAEHGFDRRYVTTVIAMAAGLAVIFACGVLWLSFVVQPSRGLRAALAAGFSPFILADSLKLLAAASVLPSMWWLTGRDPN